MSVYFTNPGKIDLEAAMTIGVNAKVTESPFGQFGTGLKYAIAVLLRNGLDIKIWSGLELYEFTSESRVSRGTEYDVVLMNERPLGFTTHLGMNWELWQVYRELYCNARDEAGESFIAPSSFPTEDKTTIMVTGLEFEKIHLNRAKFILSSPVIETMPTLWLGDLTIHEGSGVFYRGILVQDVPTNFAYNFSRGVKLTEDRTIANSWETNWAIAAAITSTKNTNILSTTINSTEEKYEVGLSYSNQSVDISMADVARELLREPKVHSCFQALQTKIVADEIHSRARDPEGDGEVLQIALAKAFISQLNEDVTAEIKIVDAGMTVLGCVRDGKIYLYADLFKTSPVKIIGTLLEEHLHFKYNYLDCSRQFQDRLVDLVATLLYDRGQREVGKELREMIVAASAKSDNVGV